jgi:hypothetical protein
MTNMAVMGLASIFLPGPSLRLDPSVIILIGTTAEPRLKARGLGNDTPG